MQSDLDLRIRKKKHLFSTDCTEAVNNIIMSFHDLLHLVKQTTLVFRRRLLKSFLLISFIMAQRKSCLFRVRVSRYYIIILVKNKLSLAAYNSHKKLSTSTDAPYTVSSGTKVEPMKINLAYPYQITSSTGQFHADDFSVGR